MRIGANYLAPGRCEFVVWAPRREAVAVQLVAPQKRLLPMKREERGYWRTEAEGIVPGTFYYYQLDGDLLRPDPASQSQPRGVHEVSQTIDHTAFNWQSAGWENLPLEDYRIYELHVGTFTPEGTFSSAIARLRYLKELGINAIELMPVAQFPGDRNWGYDGVYPFAPQSSYGGVDGLKSLVDACHREGIAVVLDVVYNHFGPEGNYTRDFAPYFTDKYRTPWGEAMNFDEAGSAGVRNFFIENALYWFREYRIDALRLDAIHAIYDFGAKHFLAELAERRAEFARQQGRPYYLIAESDLNDVRVINPPEKGGHGLDAQWSDDFHHTVHTLLTGEQTGYYRDFGSAEQLAKVLREGYAYSWDYSRFRQRYHGSYAGDRPPSQFVVCSQNHDQVGNRMLGERLCQLVEFESLKLAAAATILSPYIPLLFMGEEFAASTPFLYFISHTDSDLVAAVREGRKREFADFHELGDPPDAQSQETFDRCKLNWGEHRQGKHGILLDYYQHLFQLRRRFPSLKQLTRAGMEVTSWEDKKTIAIGREWGSDRAWIVLNVGDEAVTLDNEISATLHKQMDSQEVRWLGTGSRSPNRLEPSQQLVLAAKSAVIYTTSMP